MGVERDKNPVQRIILKELWAGRKLFYQSIFRLLVFLVLGGMQSFELRIDEMLKQRSSPVDVSLNYVVQRERFKSGELDVQECNKRNIFLKYLQIEMRQNIKIKALSDFAPTNVFYEY